MTISLGVSGFAEKCGDIAELCEQIAGIYDYIRWALVISSDYVTESPVIMEIPRKN